jgi:hypothetical protein
MYLDQYSTWARLPARLRRSGEPDAHKRANTVYRDGQESK